MVIHGEGPISLEIDADIEPFVNGSVVHYAIQLRAGRFKEMLISTELTSLINNVKAKMQFELPSIAQTLTLPKPPTLSTSPAPSTSGFKEAPREEVKTIEAPKEVKVGISYLSDDFDDVSKRLYEDIVLKTHLALRSKFIKTVIFRFVSKKFIKDLLKEVGSETSDILYVTGDVGSSGLRFRALIKGKKLKAVTIEGADKGFYGKEALRELLSVKDEVKCRVFSAPKEILKLLK
ncbi:MAG TPA: hypothetical protein ENF75_05040 [Acidilobales archaeon]|nr:hypothetical protein [Acidilobales archaeon]